MLENVKGFEFSEAHGLLLSTLNSCGYAYDQFLLSPTHFSIPNSRLRYYLIAQLDSSNQDRRNDPNSIHTQVPLISPNDSKYFQMKSSQSEIQYLDKIAYNSKTGSVRESQCNTPIGSFLEPDVDFDKFKVEDAHLLRYAMILDIVDSDSKCCNCFTKSYAHRLEGTGSVLKTSPPEVTVDQVYKSYLQLKNDGASEEEQLAELKRLRMRYFTPREIANLMCFPDDLGEFKFYVHL